MIDKQPVAGDLTDWLMEPYDANDQPAPMLHVRPAERESALLGPDGEPLMVPFPRPKLGFDLTPKRKDTACND